VIGIISFAMINYISYKIDVGRTKQMMICYGICVAVDVLIELLKSLISYGLLLYIGGSNSTGGSKRKCILSLFPVALMNRLR